MRLVRLIDDLLDLFEKDPEYRHYMLDGQTIILDDYLQVRPERFEDLRRFVKEDRLSIGPWHILPDEFLVSSEATVRNLLQGERTAARFGGKMKVGYIPDPFGHIGQMPQILRGFDIHYASLQRGLDDQPLEFWWQSPDGSRVLMCYLRDGYGNACGLPAEQPESFASETMRRVEMLEPHTLTNQLVLMHGIDHMLPHPDTSRALAYMQKQVSACSIRHSSFPEVFEALEMEIDISGLDLLVIEGELHSSRRHPLLQGVLSARTWIKQRNAAAENLLEKWAEPFSVLADLLAPNEHIGRLPRRPAALIRQAWRQLMECHPHDSICGCSVDQVHDEMVARFDQVDQIGEETTRQSLEHIASHIDTCPPDAISNWCSPHESVIVFNPNDIPLTGNVEATIDGLGSTQLLDASGQPVPMVVIEARPQRINEFETDRRGVLKLMVEAELGRVPGLAHHKFNIHELKVESKSGQMHLNLLLAQKARPNFPGLKRELPEIKAALEQANLNDYYVKAFQHSSKVIFQAVDVPPHGYQTYWVVRSACPAPGMPEWEDDSEAVIENEFYRVEVADNQGTLTLTDNLSGAVFTGLNCFVDSGEAGDEYNYSPPENDRLVNPRVVGVSVRRTPVEQAVRLDLIMETPIGLSHDRCSRSNNLRSMRLTTTASLKAGVPILEIHTTVDNNISDHRLQVCFSAPFTSDEAFYDGHFEIVSRPIQLPKFDETWIEQPRPENPQRDFIAVHDTLCKSGLVIANRGLREAAAIPASGGTTVIALTLLRCVGWLSRSDLTTRRGEAGPMLPTPGPQMQGTWSFDYAVIPFGSNHASIENAPSAYALAHAFNAPLRAATAALESGQLPGSASFLMSDTSEFVISAVKTAEDEKGWIMRGYSISDQELFVSIKLWRPFAQIERCSLAEQPECPLNLNPSNKLELEVHPHEIVTIRLR